MNITVSHFLAIVGLFLGLLCTGCSMRQEAHLVVGVSADYPPFEFSNNGDIQGFDVDLIRWIAGQMGKKVIVQDMSFSALIPALQSGTVDLVISGIAKTPERAGAVDFSAPYFVNKLALVVPKKTPITTLAELPGHTLGVQLGSTMEQCAHTACAASVKIITMDTHAQLIQQLCAGRLDAVLMNEPQAQAFVKKYPQLVCYPLAQTDEGFAIACQKNSPLCLKINQLLVQAQQSGLLAQWEQQWITGGVL